jgi:hypothetical protein
MTTAQAEVVEPAPQEPRIYIAPYEPFYDPYPRRTYVYAYPIHTNPFFCKPHHGGFHNRRPFVGPLPHWDRRDGFHRPPGRGGFVMGGGLPQHREPDVVTTLRESGEPSIRVAPMRPSVTSPRRDVTPDQTSTFGASGHRASAPPARSSPPPGRFGVNRDGGGGQDRGGNVTSSLGGRR